MGIFTYTPEEKPAVAKVTYKEKEYKFNLPGRPFRRICIERE